MDTVLMLSLIHIFLEQYMQQVANQLSNLNSGKNQEEKEEQRKNKKKNVVVLKQEDIEKMYQYMELNYGRSYLTEQEQKKINYQMCRGAHEDCSLYYTDGILENPVKLNAQYVNAKKQREDVYKRQEKEIELIVENHPTSAKIKKIDEDLKTDLEGVVFFIWREGEEKKEFTTDKNGEIYLEELVPGRYYLEEKKPPKGYLLTEQRLSFVVDKDGKIEGKNEWEYELSNTKMKRCV